MNIIQLYWNTVKKVFAHPRAFFQHLPSQGGISTPLAYALVTHWIGTGVSYLWTLRLQLAHSSWLEELLSEISEEIHYSGKSALVGQAQQFFSTWISSLGMVILDPFLILIKILVTSLFVFIAARILVTPGRGDRPQVIQYKAAVQVISYGLTPSLLMGIPWIGSSIAMIYTFFLTIIGIRSYYRVSTLRGIVIYLFPYFIIFGIIGLGSLAVLAFIAAVGFLI